MRAVILGSSGQLGMDLTKTLVINNYVYPINRSTVDFVNLGARSFEHYESLIFSHGCDVVINAAAMCGVAKCEDNPSQAYQINAVAPGELAKMCHRRGIKLVHISTNYVFSGKVVGDNYEGELPDPLNMYGLSKLAGENAIKAYTNDYIIVRVAALFGIHSSISRGGNFVEFVRQAVLKGRPLSIVNDQEISPCSTHDLSIKIQELVMKNVVGTRHIFNKWRGSWYDLACLVAERMGTDAEITAKSTNYNDDPIRRPRYGALGSYHNDILRPLKDAVDDYLTKRQLQDRGSCIVE